MVWRAAAVLALTGCAAAPPRAPVLQSRNADDAIAAVAAREAAIRTLRARFSATTSTDDGTRTVQGVLLVAKPDRLRFRLYLPLGLTVFDYLRVGDRAWVTLPLGRNDSGSAPGAAMEGLERGFVRLTGERELTRCRPSRSEDGALWLSCCDHSHGDACDTRRSARIRLSDGAIEEERVEAEQNVTVIRYDDYRVVDSAFLPYRIAIVEGEPPNVHTVDVTIDRYEINPALADGQFAPAPESQSLPSPVSRLPPSVPTDV
jgi:outer membrane lipoprotein-sorting protein